MSEPETGLAVAEPSALAMPEPTLRAVVTEPGQMGIAQRDLITWCEKKLAALAEEQAEAIASFEIARKAKWRSAPLKAAAGRIGKRMLFYEKVKQALEAGFVIVPDFPCEVFAVRTDREPRRSLHSRQWDVPTVKARGLPAGAGQYAPPAPLVRHSESAGTKDGKPVTIHRWWACGLAEMEFPVAFAHPAVMSATARAMALRLFDELAIVRQQRDPIVLGRIIDPTRGMRFSPHAAAFFLAWWCRESDL